MTMTQNDTFLFRTILTVHKRKVIHQNSRFAYSTHTQQLTVLFLVILALFCLTSHSTNEQTAEKCRIFAEEKQHSAI